jgi:hypothetical protein
MAMFNKRVKVSVLEGNGEELTESGVFSEEATGNEGVANIIEVTNVGDEGRPYVSEADRKQSEDFAHDPNNLTLCQ